MNRKHPFERALIKSLNKSPFLDGLSEIFLISIEVMDDTKTGLKEEPKESQVLPTQDESLSPMPKYVSVQITRVAMN